jgi:hypothetical protein
MKYHLKASLCTFVVCVMLFLSGCSTGIISFLAKDSMEQDRGLIMLRLRIKDPTGTLWSTSMRFFPEFILQQEGHVDQDRVRLEAFDGDEKIVWKKEKDTYYFDQYYFLVGRPGRYFIKSLYFDLGSTTQQMGRMQTTTHNWFSAPLYIAADLKNEGLVLLGTIDFELNSVQANKISSKSFNYTLRFDDSSEQQAEVFKHFLARYPVLSKKYEGHQITGRPLFGFYTNFNQYLLPGSDESKRWPGLSSETCVISSRSEGKMALVLDGKNPDKNKPGYSTMKDALALPNAYTIQYQMRWIGGMNDAVYGFQIRQNEKNTYYFGVTAAGTPVVWIKKDGQWLESPPVNRISKFLSSKDQPDDFKIDFKGGEFTYRINDETACTFKDVLGTVDAKIGFFVSGTQKAAVDSIAVSGR